MFDRSPVGFLIMNRSGLILKANRRFREIVSMPTEMLVGKPFHQFLDETDEKRFFLHFPEFFMNPKKKSYTYRLDANSQDPVFIQISGHRDQFCIGSDDVVAEDNLFVSITDVTLLKNAERALENQRDFLDTLIETIPNPVFYKDERLKYSGCNHAFETLIGQCRKNIIGKTVFDVVPQELADRYDEMDRELKTSLRSQTYFSKVESANGEVKHVVFHKAPIIKKGGFEGLVGVILDISARVEAEEDLRMLKDRLERLLESVPVGIVIVDYETMNIVDVNAQAMAILGTAKEMMIGYRCNDHFCPAQTGKCPIKDKGQIVDRSERQAIDSDGNWIPILKTVIPIEMNGKKLLLECFLDITEQKQIEHERLKNEKLRTAVELVGGICHEMNQPLQSILGYSELIMQAQDESQSAKWNRQIYEDVQRLGNITKKIMNLTQFETKSYINETKIVDIDRSSDPANQEGVT
jgi:PAS domain S-box-containing protein